MFFTACLSKYSVGFIFLSKAWVYIFVIILCFSTPSRPCLVLQGCYPFTLVPTPGKALLAPFTLAHGLHEISTKKFAADRVSLLVQQKGSIKKKKRI